MFARDKKCVMCELPAEDAHHILERRLWDDGGYYLSNGVSLCAAHHIEAEETTISCEELRRHANITDYPLPEHLSQDQSYDKWGNPIMANGMRLMGELFDEVAVQHACNNVLNLFTDRVKYPRTYHFPWSPGRSDDDKVLHVLDNFIGQDVVVTAKMDGECTTMYNDYIHARSMTYETHPSRSWVRALHGMIKHDIPKRWRVCGENLYARHSIEYKRLDSYFQVFSIWSDKNVCLNWDDTVEWASLLNLKTVPVLYRGPWDEKKIEKLSVTELHGDPCEGYVVRIAGSFHYKEFRTRVAKYVRADHVQSTEHWKHSQVVPNGVLK